MADIPKEVLERYSQVERIISKTKRNILDGAPSREAPNRRQMYTEREALKKAIDDAKRDSAAAALSLTHEAAVETNDILRLAFFHAGLIASRAVGRIEVASGFERATGFLVSPDVVMTNAHVLPDAQFAEAAEIHFEDFDFNGDHVWTSSCKFAPDRFIFVDEALDLAIVAIEPTSGCKAVTRNLGWHPLIGGEGKILIGDPVNIIQYPGGFQKSIVVHNSNLVHIENGGSLDSFCWYTSDTQKGSSGSPVFNNRWEVVAVHHRSIPKRSKHGSYIDPQGKEMTRQEYNDNPARAVHIANEGTRVSRIVKALAAATFDDSARTKVRDDLLKLWKGSQVINHGQLAARQAGHRETSKQAPDNTGRPPEPEWETIHMLPRAAQVDGESRCPINIHFHFGNGNI